MLYSYTHMAKVGVKGLKAAWRQHDTSVYMHCTSTI